MPRLYLVRHAKAADFVPGCNDHQRPLTERGHAQAAALREYLRQSGVTVDQVLCSTSTRTRQTLTGLELNAPAAFSDVVYHGSADDLRNELATLSGDSAMIIGHNPAIGDLARDLAGPDSQPTAIAQVHDRFPTAALAEIQTGSWPDLFGPVPAGCRLIAARFA